MTDSLFTQAAEAAKVADTQPVASVSAEGTQVSSPDLNELVGEGRKYKTEADALASVPHAQTHIAQLEDENRKLAAALASANKVDALIDKLEEQGATAVPTEVVPPVVSEVAPETASGVTESQIVETVTRLRAEEVKAANYKLVEAALIKKYGTDGVSKQLIHIANTVGMQLPELQELAERAPEAFFKIADVQVTTSQAPQVAVPKNSQTAQAGGVAATGVQDFKYFESIRRSDSQRYWSPEVQNALHERASQLGAAFFTP